MRKNFRMKNLIALFYSGPINFMNHKSIAIFQHSGISKSGISLTLSKNHLFISSFMFSGIISLQPPVFPCLINEDFSFFTKYPLSTKWSLLTDLFSLNFFMSTWSSKVSSSCSVRFFPRKSAIFLIPARLSLKEKYWSICRFSPN